jgi:hypothetical protein
MASVLAQTAARPVQAPCKSRRTAVRVAALQQDAAAPAAPLRFLAAGLAAAALATATPAEAGVVLVQPEVKNFVKDTPAAASSGAKKAAAPAKKAAAAKKEEGGAPGAGFEAFRPAVLPLALVAIAGAGAAAVKADPEFAKLLDESWGAKNSNAIGAGYETAPGLKDTPFFGGSNTSGAKPARAAAPAKKAGTTKKAAGTGTTKKSVLGSVFGSRG